mmetsp:Transcript_62708/g.123995  ORF Transcript_62708/g.123995 Transcript_62708/m.123995 type:complete len:158 (-) Transcript_62708:61-534(-)
MNGKEWLVLVASCISIFVVPMLIAHSIAASTTIFKCLKSLFGLLNIMSGMWHFREMEEIVVFKCVNIATHGKSAAGWADPMEARLIVPIMAVKLLGSWKAAMFIHSLTATTKSIISSEGAADMMALQHFQQLYCFPRSYSDIIGARASSSRSLLHYC